MGALAPPASAQSSDWVIFAHDSTLVGARATVHGDVVVQDARTASHLADSAELTLDVDASVLGSLTADSVSLRARASVSGGVIMNDFKADATATTGSTPTSPASLPLDFMFGDAPEMSAPENAPSVTVSAGGFDELAPGEYGTVTLASGDAEEPTILVLGQGEYVLGDLILGDHAFFAFQADAFVIVTGRLSVGDASYIGLTIEPPAGLTYDQTGVIVLGQNGSDGAMLSTPAAATFGTGSMANTQIWAPNGTLQIGADDFFMGRAAGRWVAVGTDAVVATPGSSCGHGIMPESIECWDGDLCTSDSCVSGACAHGEIPNCDASPPQWPEQAWLMAEPAGDGDASLTWTAATDNIAVTSYQILQDGSLIAEVAGTETSAIIEDLGYGTWHLAIVAKDAAGNLSQTMTTLDLILSDTAPPTWPIPFQAEDVHATWVDLSWSAAADNVGVDHYELRQDGVLIANLGSTVTSYRAESLPLGTLVDFSLHALDAAQNRSDFGPTWGILTRDSDPPETDPSSILNATLDGYGLVVDWSQASWTDDEGVAGYGILVFANGYWTGTSASPPSTSVSFESLWAPTYAVVVVAQDAAGNSSTPVTASINMVAETIPPTWDPGTQFKAIASSPVTADFFWSSAYDASGVVAYRILEAGQARLEVQGNRTQATLWDFSPDTTHTFQIQAVDFWGNTATFPTEITPRPQTDRPTWIGAPFMSATPISGTELQLDWSLGSSEFDFVYELMILPVDPTVPGGFAGIFGPGVTTARVTGLSPRVAYVATVLLRDDYRLEAIEKPSTLVVMPNDWSALPSIQTGLQARLGTVSSQVRSTWDGVLDAVTPAERESITKRCDAMGLRGSTLSVGTDGRGQVTSLSACRMSLATSVGPGAGPEAIAKAFVADNAALFAIDPTEMVGRVGLETVSIHAERAGGSRVRLVQSIDGLPVFTSQFRVVVSPDGYVTRAGGHLTPPAAVSWASGGVTDEQAKATAAEAFGADPTAGVTLLAGIYDSAAGGFTGKPAVLAWRARVHGHPSAPDAYIDRGDGSVLRLDERGASMTWDELAPAERRVEAFSQEVQPCTEFNAVTGVCTVTGTITAKPLLAVAPYVNPEMLQYSTITETTPGFANHCGNPTPPGTGEFFTYCADAVTGALAPCVQDAPECRAAEPSANGEALADALNGVGAFYYEWTGSVGWDKDADATLHRLRAVTDFRSVAGQVANLCEISSAFDLLADSQPPARWFAGGQAGEELIAVSSDLLRNAAGVLIDDDAFEFAIAHETSHAIDHHEGKLGMSSLTTAGWIREGLGDVFGVLRQAYERDPITGLVAPDWYKGLQCTGSGCPCVDSTSPSFAVPNTILGVASPTPTHISEVCFACSENHNGYLISKLAQLMGDPDNSGTHHGVTVPFVLDVGWTYKDLTQLFIDTLVGAATGSLEDMRDGLFQAAQDLTQTLGDADAIAILTMVRAAADAIGLWSVAAAVGAAVPADQDIALASRGGFHYSFWAASAGFLCYHTQACAFGGECTGGIVDLAVPISTGPAAATIGDTIFTVFGGEDGSLRMASLGPNGFWAEGPHPSAATGAVGVELGTNVTPALVEDDGELYLFYKEGSAANAPVRAMRLPFVDGVPGPQWELLPTSPAVLASTGLSVASAGLDIPETTTQARIFVAFGTPDGTESDALVLWEFAAAAPSPNSLSYWETIGVDGETYVKPPIVGRPTVAYFRGLVQVAARVEAGGSLNAVVHARCEPQPAGGCENWHTAWPLEGSGEQRPAALGLADANAPSDTARLGLWSLPATGAAFAKPMLRSKASD